MSGDPWPCFCGKGTRASMYLVGMLTAGVPHCNVSQLSELTA